MTDALKDFGRFMLKNGRIFWLLGGMALLFILKGLMALLAMTGLLGGGSAGAGGMGGMGGGAMGMPVEVAVVRESDLQDTVTVAGSLKADKGITLRPEVTGVVRKLPFTEGSMVSASTVLVQLDDALTKASMTQARAQLRLAQRNLDRLRTLREQDEALVSKRDYDSALSAMEVASADVQTAQAQLDKTHIAAPFTGTVGLQQVSIGEYVSPGQALVTLQALDPLKVEFALPEGYSNAVTPGTPIDIEVDALDGKTISATVTAVDPAVSSSGRNVNITAQIANPNGELRPGMFARVVTNFGQAENALQVPEEAIVPEGDAKFVYRVVDGKAVKTPVTLGIRGQGSVQIVNGLAKGDVVVTAGMLKIGDGAPVTPLNLSVQNSAPQGGLAPGAAATMPAAGPAQDASGSDTNK